MELDDEKFFLKEGFPKEQRNKLLMFIAIATVINLFLGLVFGRLSTIAYHLDGSLATASEITWSKVRTFLFGIPIMGFLFGTIGSLFPYKGLAYGEKYLRASLISMLVLNMIFLCLAVFKLLIYK
jgi:Na+-transporting NADH:ubiquinone oxidoreductase subunit NqrB